MILAVAGAVAAMLAQALPQLPAHLRAEEAHAIESALAHVRPEDRSLAPSAALVVAVIAHESGGLPGACANDRRGGSARGLMQVRRPRSRCRMMRADPLYGIEHNVAEGVRILIAWARFERDRHGGHDVLYHYSGGSTAYVAEVRATEARLAR